MFSTQFKAAQPHMDSFLYGKLCCLYLTYKRAVDDKLPPSGQSEACEGTEAADNVPLADQANLLSL